MFTVKYLVMHKVQMHGSAISKLLYGFAAVGAILHSLKFVDCIYLPVQAHKLYNNLHFSSKNMQIHSICYFSEYWSRLRTSYLMRLRKDKAPQQRLAIL